MYLSRIALDVKRRATIRALTEPQLLHGAVENSFEGDRKRRLWRTDWMGDDCFLLILSDAKPDFTQIVQQFGFSDRRPMDFIRAYHVGETKVYDGLLERLQVGQLWRFRLMANPTTSSFEKRTASGRGKVFAVIRENDQLLWLQRRAELLGFSLKDGGFGIVHSEWKEFRKGKDGGRKVSMNVVTFEGVLTILDVERFRMALINGVGREKAYGCGLLTVMGLG